MILRYNFSMLCSQKWFMQVLLDARMSLKIVRGQPAEVTGSTNTSTKCSVQLLELLKGNEKYNVPRPQPQPGGDKALVQR